MGLLRPTSLSQALGGQAPPARPSDCACPQHQRTPWPSCCRCCGTSGRRTAAAPPAPRPRSPAASWSCRREARPAFPHRAPAGAGRPWCTLCPPPRALSSGGRPWVSPGLGELGSQGPGDPEVQSWRRWPITTHRKSLWETGGFGSSERPGCFPWSLQLSPPLAQTLRGPPPLPRADPARSYSGDGPHHVDWHFLTQRDGTGHRAQEGRP